MPAGVSVQGVAAALRLAAAAQLAQTHFGCCAMHADQKGFRHCRCRRAVIDCIVIEVLQYRLGGKAAPVTVTAQQGPDETPARRKRERYDHQQEGHHHDQRARWVYRRPLR